VKGTIARSILAAGLAALPLAAAHAGPDKESVPVVCYDGILPSVVQGMVQSGAAKYLLQDDATGNWWLTTTNITRGRIDVAVFSPSRKTLCSAGSAPSGGGTP
jgi:hypothetical protein